MKRTIPGLAVAVLLISACAQTPGKGVTDECSNATVTINVRSQGRPTASPENACVRLDSTETMNVTPGSIEAGTVTIIAKPSNPDGGGPQNWLSGINSPDAGTITIDVPAEEYFEPYCSGDEFDEQDCVFEYTVFGPWGSKDPRVTVLR